MRYTIFKDTRVGARSYNQDRMGFWSEGEALMLALADGMGGHARGELAAQIAIDCIGAAFRVEAKPRVPDPGAFLPRAIQRAHAMIVHQGRKLGLPDMPRTTVVACVLQGGYAWWSFVGDSRLYLIRDGRVVTRTRDHTVVQQLVDAGRIREEAVAVHPDRNKLLRCLGGPVAPRIDPTATARLTRDDLVLLCSDGLWGPLTQRQILNAVIGRDPDKALPELVALAEKLGGATCDNISVLALQWLEEAVPPSEAEITVPLEPDTELRVAGASAELMRLTDADIERQIDEIKAALKKQDPEGR